MNRILFFQPSSLSKLFHLFFGIKSFTSKSLQRIQIQSAICALCKTIFWVHTRFSKQCRFKVQGEQKSWWCTLVRIITTEEFPEHFIRVAMETVAVSPRSGWNASRWNPALQAFLSKLIIRRPLASWKQTKNKQALGFTSSISK